MMVRNAGWMILCAALAAGCSCGDDTTKSDAGSTSDSGVLDGGGDGGADAGTHDAGTDGGQTDAGASDGGKVIVFPPGDAGFVIGDGGTDGGTTGDGVGTDPHGHVVLNSEAVDLHYAWIANHAQGWVSKYDSTATLADGGLKEVARYWSAIPFDGIDGGVLPGIMGSWAVTPLGDGGLDVTAYSNNPSRTAIDLNGDMWVANRAVGFAALNDAGIQGSVTKIANRPEDCIDRNGDGIIQTSQDVSGDGVIQDAEMIMPTNPADPSTYDECVLFSTEIADRKKGAVKGRGLAVSIGIEGTAGYVWAVDYEDHTVVKIDPVTGARIPVLADGGDVALPFGGYGAVVDGKGRLWVIQAPGDTGGHARIAQVNTATGEVVVDTSTPDSFGNANNYGVGIDGKDRVWVAGWNSGPYAFRYDPAVGPDGGWTKFDFSNLVSQANTKLYYSRGIAIDENGRVFMSGDQGSDALSDGGYTRDTNGAIVGHAAAMLVSFDAEDGGILPLPLPGGGTTPLLDLTDTESNTSIGVGLASDGKVWVNNYSGNAMRIDPATGVVAKAPKQSGSANLYTYSDFTGYQLRHYVAPSGSLYQVVSGCGPLSLWRGVEWDAALPPGTAIDLYVQVSENKNDFGTSTRFGPYPVSPADLQQTGTANLGPVPQGSYLRLQFKLSSTDRTKTPVLNGFHVDWSCEAHPN